MAAPWKPVKQSYFGQPIGNTQDPDEPYDNSQGTLTSDGMKIGGRGSQGGGSQAPRQRGMTTTGNARGGSYKLQGSYPKSMQKIRG